MVFVDPRSPPPVDRLAAFRSCPWWSLPLTLVSVRRASEVKSVAQSVNGKPRWPPPGEGRVAGQSEPLAGFACAGVGVQPPSRHAAQPAAQAPVERAPSCPPGGVPGEAVAGRALRERRGPQGPHGPGVAGAPLR